MADDKTHPVLCICTGDLHLTERPPVARSCEADWLAVQAGYLKQLADLAYELNPSSITRPFVVYCGDIFDKYNPSPTLVNFAIQHLPKGYAIAGNHDLPFGRYDDLHRTAFYTLVKASVLTLLEPDKPIEHRMGFKPVRLHGFPHGHKLRPLVTPHDMLTEVAVVHAYVWTKNTGYPGVSPKARLTNLWQYTSGYDAVMSGDNHQGFTKTSDNVSWCNAGTFMRRKADEKGYKPCVGLLHADGGFTRHYLDVSKDEFVSDRELVELQQQGFDAEDFINQLAEMGDVTILFQEAVHRFFDANEVSEPVRRLTLQALEGKNK